MFRQAWTAFKNILTNPYVQGIGTLFGFLTAILGDTELIRVTGIIVGVGLLIYAVVSHRSWIKTHIRKSHVIIASMSFILGVIGTAFVVSKTLPFQYSLSGLIGNHIVLLNSYPEQDATNTPYITIIHLYFDRYTDTERIAQELQISPGISGFAHARGNEIIITSAPSFSENGINPPVLMAQNTSYRITYSDSRTGDILFSVQFRTGNDN